MDTMLAKQATDLAAEIQAVTITDRETAVIADKLVAAGKDMAKKIKDFFSPLKRAQDDAKRVLLDAERAELQKIEPAVEILSRSLATWRIEQDRIRREAEEKARRQEAERRRLEMEALRQAEEKARKAQEEQRRIDQEAAAKALATKNREIAERIERERRQKQEELAAKAKAEQDAIIDKAAAEEAKLEPVVVVPEKAKFEDTGIRHNWKFRVVDAAAVPPEYKVVDEVKVGRVVRAASGQISIPGIEIYDEPTITRTR